MANGNNAGGPHPALVILVAFAWFALCWVLPVIRLRDEKTTANMKTIWSGWLVIAGMGPIFYGGYKLYNTRGNAASANTGGNLPPGAFPVNQPTGNGNGSSPKLPSAAAGAENAKASL